MGDFKNAGQTWSLEPIAVNVHDYPHDALGRAVPYGVYDITTNRGFIYLGTSGDTPDFVVDAIAAWWQSDGHTTSPGNHLLVLADAGGSNGCRVRAWKERLQRVARRDPALFAHWRLVRPDGWTMGAG